MDKSNIKTCSFFGHRNVEITEELRSKTKRIIEDLIKNHNVFIFLFGSRSNFNTLCHQIVSVMMNEHKDIKRVLYNCKSESCVFESERQKWEEICSKYQNQKVDLLCVEAVVEHKTKFKSGRASYVERNQAMIDGSDYCVFYYDENYKPEMRKYSKRSIGYYQPKSGTALAYAYAKRKRKNLINVFQQK